MRYEFGKNWQKFLKNSYSEERVEIAKNALLKGLRRPDLTGLTFLDIGCGSGLHSLGAFRAGANKIVSFDFDAAAVEATKSLWITAGRPTCWEVLQGSALDPTFLANLGRFDVVYAWGSLHHTGDMWQALENVLLNLAPEGVFFVALYSDTVYRDAAWTSGQPFPEEWIKIKKAYNRASSIEKKRMEAAYIWHAWFSGALRRPWRFPAAIKNFNDAVRSSKIGRGMDIMTAIRDWLGGYPMEFVREKDLMDFMEKNGLELLNLHTGEGNSEFLFRPQGARNWWDKVLDARSTIILDKKAMKHADGQMWRIELSALQGVQPDCLVQPPALTLTENGKMLPFRHAPLAQIAHAGEGRYHYSDKNIYFSSTDRSNPTNNNYEYACYFD